MNDQVQIGKATYGRQNGFGAGPGFFHVEANKDNIYRVLPPMKSLAPHGKYSKRYRTHRGFRGTDGKQKPFICIEEKDYKTKFVKVHCPVCDRVAELEQEIVKFQAKGATPEQIQDYRGKYVFPLQSENKYYLNVVNQEGKIGILPISSTMHQSLELLAQEQEKAGRDITGMQGVFLNFKVQKRFKGDRDAVHKVDLYMHPAQDGSFRYLSHDITAEFAARLGKEAADLGSLFKVLDAEQIARIVSLEGAAQAGYIDTLFAAPEQVQGTQQQQGMQTQIPGSNLVAVSRVEINQGGDMQVQQPTVPSGFSAPSVQPNQNFGQFQGAQQVPLTQGPAIAQPGSAMGPLTPPPMAGNSAVPATQGFVGFQQQPVQQMSVQTPVQQTQVVMTPPSTPSLIPGKPMATLNDDEFLACIPKKKE